jgi:hypothetical protein
MSTTAGDPYRAALEAEGGEPVSAGARASLPPAVVTFDLSFVPSARRAGVVAEIHERIAREVRDAQPVASPVDAG